MRLPRRRRRRRQPERHAVEPGHGLVRHRSAQLAERHVAGRIGAQEVDEAALVGRIALLLRRRYRQHHVAMGVVDGQHAVGAVDADLQAVDGARPGHRQCPRDVEVIDAAVREHDHAGGGIDAAVGGPQHLVDRARVALDRRLGLQVPHDDVERVRARDHHRRDGLGIVRALVIVDGDQPVHEGAAGDERHVPQRAGAHLLLGGEPLAAKALGIADDGIDRRPARWPPARARIRPGPLPAASRSAAAAPRSTAARMGATCRCSSVAMMAAVTSGRLQQLAMVLRDEIRLDLAADLAGPVGVLLGEPDPLAPRDGVPPPRRGRGRRDRRRRSRDRCLSPSGLSSFPRTVPKLRMNGCPRLISIIPTEQRPAASSRSELRPSMSGYQES